MELVRVTILATLATLCYGQQTAGSGSMSTDVPLMSPTPTPNATSSFPIPTPTEIPVDITRSYRLNDVNRPEYGYQLVYFTNNSATDSAYNGSIRFRYARYNCHDRNGSGYILNRVPSRYVFTVFLQMPTLHFLDVRYKIELMESIRTLLNINGINRSSDDEFDSFRSPPEICIDGYDQAYVGSYDEGVMLRIYQRPNATSVYPEMDGSELENAFNGNLGRIGEVILNVNPTRIPLTIFGGERAVLYNGPDGRAAVIGGTWTGRVSINLRRECRQLDPEHNLFNGTQLVSADLTCRSLYSDEQDDLRERLAANPNPINYYLVAGDYIFAILGGLAVAIVLGLATLGYFIHPFFLA